MTDLHFVALISCGFYRPSLVVHSAMESFILLTFVLACVHACVCVRARAGFRSFYRGTDKSLARPGRKQVNVSVRIA